MAINAADVKKLREITGCGMMDCKKALSETNGDFEAAKDYLRKKGETKAAKKSARATGEGRIGYYIHHNNKIGAMVEMRTESDFVANNEVFAESLRTICMHIAASNPIAVNREDIPTEVIEREKNVYAESEDVLKKPEKIRPKIIEGKLNNFFKENVLLEQPLVSDPQKTVEDFVKEVIAKFGENMVLVRFARFEVGETGDE